MNQIKVFNISNQTLLVSPMDHVCSIAVRMAQISAAIIVEAPTHTSTNNKVDALRVYSFAEKE